MLLLAFQLISYSVTLAYDASPDSSVTGYYIYYGNSHNTYDTKIDVGNVLQFSVQNLKPMKHYYFAATAHTIDNVESLYSNEVDYLKPCFLKIEHSDDGPNQVITLNTEAYQGMPFRILGSADLTSWNEVYTGTAAADSFFIAFNPVIPAAFFRLEKLETPAEKIKAMLPMAFGVPALQYKKPTNFKLLKWYFRFKPFRHTDERRGAELLRPQLRDSMKPELPPLPQGMKILIGL